MDLGLVQQVDINNEMREAYLSYAMSVIVSRALPDARDGLKPVQRRILYAMNDMGLYPERSYKKSARIVGEVLGKYHPHGDQSVYDAMVRLTQDFSMRYPLVDGQGNFGSIDGDAAAAMRYTEARMAFAGRDLLNDLGKETVDFTTNFDDSLAEPAVLPAEIPNFLINGSTGIAVGMSTSVPPHNLGEVVDALCFMLKKWEKLDDVTVPDLMEFIKGPDFPTGGMLFTQRDGVDGDMLAKAYGSGRGKVIVRGKAHIEQMDRNKSRIVITELPYQTNKSNLLTRIADLHRDGRLEGLTDLRDESDRNGMRICIETTRTVDPKDVLNDLFKLTPLQSTFSIIMLALVKGEPRMLTLKQALRVYIEHRLEIVQRRSEYDLARARDRAHILEGLLIALDHLDEVIALIRKSRSADSARNNLIKKFKLTDIQARAILDMQLRRLAALERTKLKDEYKEVTRQIKELETLLARPDLMRGRVKEELLAVKARYGDTRRTQIVTDDPDKVLTASDLVPDQNVWVVVGQNGGIGRTTSRTMFQIPPKPTEPPSHILEANTRDVAYLISADGDAVGVPVYQLPQARSMEECQNWSKMTAFSKRNYLAAVVIVPADMIGQEDAGYVFLTTLGGVVKRVRLEDLPGVVPDPFTIMRIEDGDALGWARFSSGHDEVLLGTANGQVIRFEEGDVRPSGLPAGGVAGVKLADEADGVVGMELVTVLDTRDPGRVALVWSITDNGLTKASPLDLYPQQKRYGQGVVNVKLPPDAEEVVAVLLGTADTAIYVTTTTGSARSQTIGDATQGSRSIKSRPLKGRSLGDRTRITGAVKMVGRPNSAEESSGKQLTLI
ncbi:MAG: DNA topoisomerase 4 subunit A [Anaerolineae bacterium]|nr:DNA topoisomerase 4 subunit A [Anaerolineae bacterium]